MTSSKYAAVTSPALTYEQLMARASDHHASAQKFAELAGMQLRANGANLDVLKDGESIMEDRPAVDVQNFLWGYVNGEDDAKATAAAKALLTTPDCPDGGANLMEALQIADNYGWTVEIANSGLTVRGHKYSGNFTEHLSGIAEFFAFANGFHAALGMPCTAINSQTELMPNEGGAA